MKHIIKHWKVYVTVAVLLIGTIIGMVNIFAADDVNISITEVGTTYTAQNYLAVGDSFQLQAVIEGTYQGAPLDVANVVWSTGDVNIVCFGNMLTNASGANVSVRAIGSGTTTITASYFDAEGSLICSKNIVLAVEFIMTNNGGSMVLNQATSLTLFTNFKSELTQLEWSIENEDVIAFHETENQAIGAMTFDAKSAGTTVVNVRTPDGQFQSYNFVVKSKSNTASTISVYPGSPTSMLEYTNVLTGSNVRWVVADETIAYVDNYGNVSARTAGTTTVYFYPDLTYDNGASINIKVEFGISQGDISLAVGDGYQLSVNTVATGVNWTTSNSSIATVSTDGVVTAKRSGTCEIKASLFNTELFPGQFNQEDTITVTVIDAFAINTTEEIINIGESISLTALVTDNNQASVTWLSDNDSIVSITTGENGVNATITGLSKGTAKITAVQNIDGLLKYAYCTIYVNEPVQQVDVYPAELEITVGGYYPLTLLFTPDLPDNMDVTWVSSDENVATVTESGVVSGIIGGDAVISVISSDGIKVASSKVHVRQPVTGITLSHTLVNTSMSVGNFQLAYSVAPAIDGVNDEVEWTSSNEEVATVDANGYVTFLTPGKVTVIAKTVDTGYNGSLIATCEFYINQPVTSVTLDYNEVTIKAAETFRLTAEVLPNDASNKTIVWMSSDETIATVDSTGLVTAVSSGTCTIIAQSEDSGVISTCNVSVYQPVTKIELSMTEVTVKKYTEFWLNAVVSPSDALNKSVTWTSSDESIATVDSVGKVTAVTPGSCVITATSTDSGLVARCTVIVTEPVTGITLNYSEVTMYANEKLAIIPTVTPIDADNKQVTYVSSDPDVATVDSNGIVTSIKGGSTIIIATTVERGLIASCKVEVYEFVKSVDITTEGKYLNINSSKTLLTVVLDQTATNRAINWSTSNPNVIAVDKYGKVTGKSLGTAVVTATAADGSGAYAQKTLRVIKPVTSIKVTPEYISMIEGESQKVTAVITPSDATIKTIDWTSSDPAVAMVDHNGEVTGITAGICYVYATSTDENNVVGTVKITIKKAIPATSVTINAKELNMFSGQTKELTARLKPSKSTDKIQWVSGDTSICTVNSEGVVTAKGQGNTQVYCISDSGVESVCDINVLVLNASSINVEQYDSYYLDVYGATDNIIWYSNNQRIATVAGGKVTGRLPGTTIITAKVNGKLLYCKVTVTRMSK